MPRQIVVNLDGEVSRFDVQRVAREKLYGRKRRVVVDQLERECSTAMLTREGSALVPQGSLAFLYVDDTGRVIDRASLQAVDEALRPVPEVEATLNKEQPLRGPVSPLEVLDHVTTSVYQLDAEELGEGLRAALERGEIFETQFAYRNGFDLWPAFLVQNEEGIFALVTRPAALPFIERETLAADTEVGDDELDDDLDFSML